MPKIKKSIIVLALLVVVILIIVFMSRGPEYPEINTSKPVFGNLNSTVKIVEFSDLQCPACKAANPVIQQIKEEYKENISFQYYHFPLRNIHPYAQKAAEAAECANDQGKFWEFVDRAFDVSPELDKDSLRTIAGQLGLDRESFDACLDSGAKKDIVSEDYTFGVSKGVRGTPTIFINDKKLPSWEYGPFKAAIEQELASS